MLYQSKYLISLASLNMQWVSGATLKLTQISYGLIFPLLHIYTRDIYQQNIRNFLKFYFTQANKSVIDIIPQCYLLSCSRGYFYSPFNFLQILHYSSLILKNIAKDASVWRLSFTIISGMSKPKYL